MSPCTCTCDQCMHLHMRMHAALLRLTNPNPNPNPNHNPNPNPNPKPIPGPSELRQGDRRDCGGQGRDCTRDRAGARRRSLSRRELGRSISPLELGAVSPGWRLLLLPLIFQLGPAKQVGRAVAYVRVRSEDVLRSLSVTSTLPLTLTL